MLTGGKKRILRSKDFYKNFQTVIKEETVQESEL